MQQCLRGFQKCVSASAFLIGTIDRKIGAVAEKGEVAHRAGNAYEQAVRACADDHVGIGAHCRDARGVVHRAALSEPRAAEHADEFFGSKDGFAFGDDVSHKEHASRLFFAVRSGCGLAGAILRFINMLHFYQ